MHIASWDRSGLEAAGFSGFVRFIELPTADVPPVAGVYVVVRTANTPVTFRKTSPAGRRNGRDPSVPVETLEEAWIEGAQVLYIGKAGPGASDKRGLRTRLAEYRRHGLGQGAPHWGGRFIWQLTDADDLVVAWLPTPGAEPEAAERALIARFRRDFGGRPFANRNDGHVRVVELGGRGWPTSPRAHRSKRFLATKRARLREPHVADLNDLVEEIRGERHVPRSPSGDGKPLESAAVPWFDPDGGGVAARVLVLLEAPGPKSVEPRGSGIISADNNDATAEAFFRLREQAGLPRDSLVAWNVVPWFLAAGDSFANASDADVRDAARWLDRLLALLPDLRYVLTMGAPARDGWLQLRERSAAARALAWQPVPHPSPQNLNTRAGAKDEILAGLRLAARAVADR